MTPLGILGEKSLGFSGIWNVTVASLNVVEKHNVIVDVCASKPSDVFVILIIATENDLVVQNHLDSVQAVVLGN